MNPEIEQLKHQVDELTYRFDQFARPDHYVLGKRVTGIPIGHIAANGTATFLPSGWTSAKNSTGNYTITHNLGHTNYVVLACADAAGAMTVITCVVDLLAANSFRVYTADAASGGTQVDAIFYFVLLYKQ